MTSILTISAETTASPTLRARFSTYKTCIGMLAKTLTALCVALIAAQVVFCDVESRDFRVSIVVSGKTQESNGQESHVSILSRETSSGTDVLYPGDSLRGKLRVYLCSPTVFHPTSFPGEVRSGRRIEWPELSFNATYSAALRKFGANRIGNYYDSYCPPTKTFAITSSMFEQESPTMGEGIVQLYLVWDTVAKSIDFVDSIHAINNGDEFPFHIAQFSNTGKALYYRKRDHAIRYLVGEREWDTLSGGDTPIIPHNTDRVLLYSHQRKHILILDQADVAIDSTSGSIEGFVCTAYEVDPLTYVIGSVNRYQSYKYLYVYLLDFRNDLCRLLFDIPLGGEIIHVEEIGIERK